MIIKDTHFIFYLFLIVFIFSYVNSLMNITEKYTGLKTKYFFNNLDKYNYKYNDAKNITFCENKDCKTKNYKYHFNKIPSVKLVKDKVSTSSILQKNHIPVPSFVVINVVDNLNKILNILETNKIMYPFIIKPINGTFGIDVQKIDTYDEFITFLDIFKKKGYQTMMIENFIEGSVYRIFVFNNKNIDVIKRDKPFIIGNGYDNVESLINKRNKEMEENGLFRTKNLSLNYMEKQGYTLNDILPSNKKLYITNVINMHNGAVLERIKISSIPIKNLDLFLKVGQILDINCYGLDYISNDISKEFIPNKDVILEVNGTPDTEIHTKIDNHGDMFFNDIVKNIF
jgi:D-alanine-D-alanine ligase-like ATP-grasp enzyme